MAGNVYCAHCGSRLTLTTNGKYRRKADGSMDTTQRIRYVCYGKTRKQTKCDGQTGYTMHKLDAMIDQIVKNVFANMKGISKSALITSRFERELADRKMQVESVRAEFRKATEKTELLKGEVIRCIQGESSFSRDMLSEMVAEAEAEQNDLQKALNTAEAGLADTESLKNELSGQYDDLIFWAKLYESASIEAKKMIVSCLIRRVEVGRDYKLNIEFNFDLSQFFYGPDFSA